MKSHEFENYLNAKLAKCGLPSLTTLSDMPSSKKICFGISTIVLLRDGIRSFLYNRIFAVIIGNDHVLRVLKLEKDGKGSHATVRVLPLAFCHIYLYKCFMVFGIFCPEQCILLVAWFFQCLGAQRVAQSKCDLHGLGNHYLLAVREMSTDICSLMLQ